jgi:DDE superfamily endonuclease
MLRHRTLPVIPASLAQVLAVLRSCFTAPSFTTFTALTTGMLAQPGTHTVCGMLTGADLARAWHHSRAYRLFALARWCPRQIGLALAGVVVGLLLEPDEPVTIAIDDTVFRRRGRTVHAAGWFHDGTAPRGQRRLVWGNNWVIAALVVTVPWSTRPVALPVLAALIGPDRRTRPQVARELVDLLCRRLPTRTVHVVGDAGYGCRALAGFDPRTTMTVRAKSNIALFELPPGRRVGKAGRPRLKGARIGVPAAVAATATSRSGWHNATVAVYGDTRRVRVTDRVCLWHGAWRTRPARLVLVRNRPRGRYPAGGYDLALVTTDLDSPVERIIARYARRWAIEVAFRDAKDLLGVGQARTRVPAAVARCVPFGLVCQTVLVLWYAQHGHDPADVAWRRDHAPWYRSKTEPCTQDMLTKLRRVIIAARFLPSSPRPATPQQIREVQQAWALAAA